MLLMISVLLFLVILSVLVLGHELGHYVAARICGVKAEEFGYGFPPRIIGFVRINHKWKRVTGKDDQYYEKTIWSLNWLPLGGFVRLKGEQGELAKDKDSFLSQNPFAKIFILSSGVFMNLVIAALIFSIGFMVGVPAQTNDLPPGATVRDPKVQITYVSPDSAAAKAGIEVGDFIREIDGQSFFAVAPVQSAFALGVTEGRTFVLSVEHDDHIKNTEVKPEYIELLKRPGVGVNLADTGIVSFSPPQAILQGIGVTIEYTLAIAKALGNLVKDLVWQGKVSADVSGPVGIAVMTGKIAEEGVWALFQFAALLSINLAIINFLPIPALDGGRVLFVLIESLRRRRNNPRFEAIVHQVGFLILLILIVLVTLKDVRTYGGVIWNGLKGVVGL